MGEFKRLWVYVGRVINVTAAAQVGKFTGSVQSKCFVFARKLIDKLSLKFIILVSAEGIIEGYFFLFKKFPCFENFSHFGLYFF